MTEPTTLRSLIAQAMERHKVSRASVLARLAQDNGHRIHATTINQIRRGAYRATPTRDTLEAIASLAGVPVRDVYRAAKLPEPGRPFVEELPADIDLLDDEERALIKGMINLFLRRRRSARPKGYRDVGNEEIAYTLAKEHLGVTDGNSHEGALGLNLTNPVFPE